MHTSRQFVAYDINPIDNGFLVPDRWLAFNRLLNRDAAGLPNEGTLARRLEALLDLEVTDALIFWLTVARLTELVLKLAGDYADGCDFQAAGDLLVNPRRIDVYIQGCTAPIPKERHRALSDQFAAAIGDQDPVSWLSQHTVPCIRTIALLPYLNQMLSSSGFMATEYLTSLDQRMCQIADTIAFLTVWQIGNCTELFRRIETANPADKKMISANLCRFGFDYFNAMGDDIERISTNNDSCHRFLRCLPAE